MNTFKICMYTKYYYGEHTYNATCLCLKIFEIRYKECDILVVGQSAQYHVMVRAQESSERQE